MPGGQPRGVIVVCGMVTAAPRPARSRAPATRLSTPIPVTWIANAERISGAAEGIDSSHDLVLQVAPAAFASRQRLRAVLARAREAVPTLSAIAIRGGGAIDHRQLLVEEGISVVLVDSLAADGRGSRRPAPLGWRCRNSSWGLWEVEMAPASRPGPLAIFGLGKQPRVRRGGLSVVATDGHDGQGTVHHRLERLTAWADRLASRGDAEAVSLSTLVARLTGDDQQALAGSVLRAA